MKHAENDNLIAEELVADAMVEQQIARHMTDLLNDSTQRLAPHHLQRLANARDAAVNHLAERQSQLQHHHGATKQGHVLRWFGDHFAQHRTTSAALVVLVMLLTFFAVQQFEVSNNLENSDAFLLASDLPPEAYADKGFDAWLDTDTN
jgi:hypothetical protein